MTQFSLDRVHAFQSLCSAWDGPVSATAYVADNQLDQLVEMLKSFEFELRNRRIRVHAVLQQGLCVTYPHLTKLNQRCRQGYPVNHLRNIALEQARTSHVLLLDVDFVPMPKLHSLLLESMSAMGVTDVRQPWPIDDSQRIHRAGPPCCACRGAVRVALVPADNAGHKAEAAVLAQRSCARALPTARVACGTCTGGL